MRTRLRAWLTNRIIETAGRYVTAAFLVGLAATTMRWDSALPADPPRLVLLYVGASDCAPCRTWQRGEGTRFQQSAEFSRLTYREIKSPTLRTLLADDHWPEEVRRYRDHLDRNSAVPLWLLTMNGQVVAKAIGESQWRQAMLPQIKALVR